MEILTYEELYDPLLVDLTYGINCYLNNIFSDGEHLIHINFDLLPKKMYLQGEHYGCCQCSHIPGYCNATIRLSPLLSMYNFKQIVIHELFHAISWLASKSILNEYITIQCTDFDIKYELSSVQLQLYKIVNFICNEHQIIFKR